MDATILRLEASGVHPLGDRQHSITQVLDVRHHPSDVRLRILRYELEDMQRRLVAYVPVQCIEWSCRPLWML